MGLPVAVGAALCLLLALAQCQAELTPPYFNLATGRKIFATATCGEDTDGPELYCKLVGANTENDHIDYSVIQGQVCDVCDPNVPDKNHPPENAIDGTEAWWQSPPLSRGMKYNEVDLTINFEQEFHVAYLFIRMGNSPRPGLWTLEKSVDYGKTWTPWQHFSDTPADCETYFGKDTYKPISRDDDVICTTEYSKIVPLENGEIPVMLLNERPSSTNYFNSSVLQEWTRATNVRIRLLRTKNLLGHLMSVARQDPTVTRRYFYSIKDISIGGRCMCNGHADTCDVKDPKSAVRILACRCQHHTCGIQCNECCPGFEQKKWRQNTNARPFNCEPCNCHGHSTECKYDEDVNRKGLSLDIHGHYDGGGVCQNCQHNTVGINCNKCKPKYYRPKGKHWNDTDVCSPCQCDFFYSTGHCEEETGNCECRAAFQPPNCDSCAYGYYGYPNCRECECNLNGTNGYHCEAESGQQCPCKINFAGSYCKQCAEGYYGFPECKACECNQIGSITNDCNVTSGECKCLTNFGGDNCERCKHGYYNYPACSYCDCDNQGTESEICNKQSGQCICREGFGGPRCDQCLPGFYNYPDCKPCNCSSTGSSAITCDNTGKCNCLNNFAGKQCTLCSAGYYSYPDCLPCHCDSHGSQGVTCNADGQCLCQPNFDGRQCDSCKESFYNFPSCEDCNCDPAGVIDKFAGCGSVPVGELCKCKERVSGRICDECKPLYWNLNISNPDGCENCDCWTDGTISGLDTCASKSGQCPCKPHTQGRRCKECRDGTFDLDSSSLFGCKDCQCDVGGSWASVCDKTSGQCKCHPRVTGRACTQPLTTHYFPTLHQFQYEYEDGTLPSGTQVRYDYAEQEFPGFSSKGYVVFNTIQNEVRNELTVFKSSLYRIVLRYVNPNDENVTATILIQSENPQEVDQNVKVLLQPTKEPKFVTVSGPKGLKPSAIVLDPGPRYVFTTKASKNVMLDYFVLLPAAYYEASILTRQISNPCELGNMELCRHYKYASVEVFEPTGVPFLIGSNGKPAKAAEVYSDPEHLQIVSHVGDVPVLSRSQPELNYIVDVPQSGRYIFVIDYISHRNFTNTYYVNLRLKNDPDSETSVLLYPCLYSTVCRTSVNDDGLEKSFYISKEDLQPVIIYADITDEYRVPIISVTAIPVDQWSIDYINPSPVCVIHNQQCSTPKFVSVPDSKKIEFETDHEDRIAVNKPPYAALDERVKLVHLDGKEEGSIVIESKVAEPGRYVILVKYYQPKHPKYQVYFTLTAAKNQYDGHFDIEHCPSSSGCRGVIRPGGEYDWFDIDDEFHFTITNDRPQGVWLDYLVVVPLKQYNEDLLVEETFDQTKEFIKNCGHDDFHITHNASEFCKKAVFSLTADYNSGALACNCDYAGSTSFECRPFGGQCQCKPNVIDRQCGSCRSRHYGFPDCKPCQCPSSAMCESTTGECMCPPNVIGDMCEKCAPNTYGFHQVIGCEECNCNYLGIANGNTQCDMFNGTCECRENIEGRACDVCAHGYYQFPRCEQCSCHKPGTELEVCDKIDGSCFCKKNVVGRDCDQCVDGTYNLQDSNPDGCTTCFCFGKTSRCDSAYLRVYNVSLLRQVSISTAEFNNNNKTIEFELWAVAPEELQLNETTLQADFTSREVSDERPAYFGVLDYLLNQNSHISSYGGDLAYTLHFSSGFDGKSIVAPDVILMGKDKVLVHQSYEQPSRNMPFANRLQMVETNFQTHSGKSVSRADFMMVLRDLKAIYIRANYWEQTLITQISDVYLSLADEDADGTAEYQFLAVERCSCPPGYVGHSCEDCAPGYYRDPNGPYGGYCIPCECNGHSETCDCATGVCTDCQHGTQGEHCEECVSGYYGNATTGTPLDCMICACPLPYDSNNFATSCEISESGNEIHCECRPGYTGPRCESCANGFYGNPEVVGDVCKPCDCSGNINPEDQGSCDTRTGECLRCLNNTFGAACNLCAPGFYGDAVKLKNCQSCDCDDLGTLECDPFVGKCTCHENVIGERCDRCKADHYGFESGLGCRACDCGAASNSTQCDAHTGHCACKPGVTGRQCDRCAVDHWKYQKDGCTPCNCNQGYSRGFGCNPNTGKCQCLPGVIGDRCDACPNRWVLIKDEGCQECNNCHHALLDVTDKMRYQIDSVLADFGSVTLAFFTSQKLNYYDNLADELVPKIKALDPTSVDLNPSKKSNSDLEADAKSYAKQVNQTLANALDIRDRSSTTLGNITNAHEEALKSADQAREAIAAVEALSKNLETAASTKIEAALEQAQHILGQINNTEIPLLANEQVLEKARLLYDDVDTLVQPIKEQNRSLNALKNDIGEFSDKLEDLFNWSEQSETQSAEVERLNVVNKQSFDNSKFDTVSEQQQQAETNIKDAGNYLINGDLTLSQIGQKLDNLRDALEELKSVNKNVDEELPARDDQHQEAEQLTGQAEMKAAGLAIKAQDLAEQYTDMTAHAEPAIKAATAYSGIVEAVDAAQQFSQDAITAAGNATQITDGIEERAGQADSESAELLQKARQSLLKVQDDLEPRLNSSGGKVQQISQRNNATEQQLKDINILIAQLPAAAQRDMWKSSNANASDALEILKNVLEILEPVSAQTPKELEKAHNINRDLDLTNKDISQANNQLDNVDGSVSKLVELAEDVEDQQQRVTAQTLKLGQDIENLKRQVETARQLANNIKVGVKFRPSTVLELKTPEKAKLLATRTNLSTFFRTNEKSGFLVFLGNDNATAQKNKDFVAVEIVNGYPILTIDLGNGPQRITNDKYVSDGKWYQAVVDRVGSVAKLTIREQLPNGEVVEHQSEPTQLEGSQNILHVDRNSRLFVGGYPGAPDFAAPEDITANYFNGDIEDLRIGDENVGLWNFVYGEDNVEGVRERDVLLEKKKPVTGLRFKGNGYVQLNATYNFKSRSTIKFNFKADKDSSNGLLFFYGRDRHYMSIELVDGAVYFNIKLGNGGVSSGSSNRYNDNQWHTVEAGRDGRTGLLKVDDILLFHETAPAEADEELPKLRRMYFGGYPRRLNNSEIVPQNFDGCIDDVIISGIVVDLTEYVNGTGVEEGCPERFSTVLSFAPNEYGFLRTHNISTDNDLHVNLRFKTRQPKGILFYATNNDQSSTIGLTLDDGYLKLRSQGSELVIDQRAFNDGEDHVVTVQHNAGELRLSVDDEEEERLGSPEPLYIESGDIFFAGLPDNYQTPRGALSTLAYFVGCISDVTVNDEIINFANSAEKKNGNINGCPPDILAYEPDLLPNYYPSGDNELEPPSPGRITTHKPVATPPPSTTTTTTTTPATTTSTTTTTTTTTMRTTAAEPEVFGADIMPQKTLTTRPTPKMNQPSDERCKLPVNPNYDVDFETGGYRFYSLKEQRLEINSLPVKLRRHHDVSISFRTEYPNGLLFYASSKQKDDFIAVYLLDGRVTHQLRVGAVLTANITSESELNDGKWHTVEIVRTSMRVSLIIDHTEQAGSVELSQQRNAPVLTVEMPIYVGGITKFVESELKNHTYFGGNTSYFNGCLKDIKFDGVALETEPTKYSVVPCSDQVESGVFFHSSSSSTIPPYVKLFERFTVGAVMTISFDFRPREPDGLLFSVHGKNSYAILELADNTLYFTVKSDAKSILMTNFTLPANESFCDGKQRHVQAIKSKFVINIAVDFVSSNPGVGNESSAQTKTNRPLFMGGHHAFQKAPGIKTKKTFKGCISNVEINKKAIRITPNMITGDIWQGYCPLA
ncbi:laminin subunit alpha [Drosophila guanche]|uniref:Laminin A chain n=1 Tax=Drosophila guanche TaxID=7266 RepID=A0A3B0JXK1_DROGU|nr:laminin subunit alpha [Drosophila guanche]SPP85142.1 blast:Laminin subunit alpha [Drosophila guanche]